MESYDIVVIGGGPAGMAAAVEAKKCRVDNLLIIERDRFLGGILQQCIHNGFGLHKFKEDLTGPQFAERYIEMVHEMGIPYKLDTMVLSISSEREIAYVNSKDGLRVIKAKAIILAMGCRERARGATGIAGSRPAGVFTAGAAQRYINIDGYMVGKKIMMLGTGDIGLIMARRLKLEGAEVVAVLARKSYPGGLMRNVVQCLHDYGIPLMLRHTVTRILGKQRVTGVLVAETDENSMPIPGTEKLYECDTLLLSVGLIPENELSLSVGIDLDRRTGGAFVDDQRETDVEGVFACGNVVHVHDLVDFVVEESRYAAKGAAEFVKHKGISKRKVCATSPGEGVRYVVPQRINLDSDEKRVDLFFRVSRVFEQSRIVLKEGERVIREVKKRQMSPGEMERVGVDRSMIEGMGGTDLTVEAVGGDG